MKWPRKIIQDLPYFSFHNSLKDYSIVLMNALVYVDILTRVFLRKRKIRGFSCIPKIRTNFEAFC